MTVLVYNCEVSSLCDSDISFRVANFSTVCPWHGRTSALAAESLYARARSAESRATQVEERAKRAEARAKREQAAARQAAAMAGPELHVAVLLWQ